MGQKDYIPHTAVLVRLEPPHAVDSKKATSTTPRGCRSVAAFHLCVKKEKNKMVRKKTNNRNEKGGFLQKGTISNFWFSDDAYGCIITVITEINSRYTHTFLCVSKQPDLRGHNVAASPLKNILHMHRKQSAGLFKRLTAACTSIIDICGFSFWFKQPCVFL